MKRAFGWFGWGGVGLALVVLSIGIGPALGGAVISEFLASSSEGLADSDGEYSDWIEIHNPDSTPVDLKGWSLTDDPVFPGKWTFPSVMLGANQRLVVFASGKNRKADPAQLHTSFSLNPEGEYLALFAPESAQAATEFSPAYPAQKSNISFGFRDGRLWFFDPPSPGGANVGGVAGYVADTKFNVDRGFFSAPFDLSITCATEGATIRYTTNGTPPTLSNGVTYGGPVRVDRTTVLRAAAFKDGLQPSNVDTQTYLFLTDVIRQAADGRAPAGWPTSWGANSVDYGMDPDVVDSALYKDTILEDMKTLPSFSVVTELRHLFDASTGIYANPGQDGRAWERPCSLELIYPDGKRGFQINAGIRIRGGFSRSTGNPKHALRFFFRDEYGAGKLRYPLFGDGGADVFDAIDLRTFQNYSWSFQGDSRGVFIRDQFSRDSQLDMGSQAERGDYYHLYINGMYWGIFNTCERPEASYGETYFGGNKEDYDVIKVEAGSYVLNATDGDMQAWTRLYNAAKAGVTNNAAYFRLQGRDPDGRVNPQLENLIDVENLIDYMLVIYYGGNLDAPISNFLGNTSPNNWYGMRDRTGKRGGFRFFAHDAEHTLLNVNENRVGPWSAGDSSVTKSNPQWIFQKFWANAEFRLAVADRVQKHMANGGALTPAAAEARFRRRMAELDRAVVGESARWGDAKRSPPYTRQTWLSAANTILTGFFPRRTDIVIQQLRARGLVSPVASPTFSAFGGHLAEGTGVTMTAPAGTVYYTLDGTDPRVVGGGLAPSAREYQSPLVLREAQWVRMRARSGADWSAIVEAQFTVAQPSGQLRITELMYNPGPDPDRDRDDFEYLEIRNDGATDIDLSQYRFTNGIVYTFPNGSRVGAGRSVVVARNLEAFGKRYPGVAASGPYSGQLSNSGERVTLVTPDDKVVFDFAYLDAAPWPKAADGDGFSLVAARSLSGGDPSSAAYWRASAVRGGSPGRDDPPTDAVVVVVNEIRANSPGAERDSIELHNPTDRAAAIGGWYLSDDPKTPEKYRIPAGTVIPAGGYWVVTDAEFDAASQGDRRFALEADGDEVVLTSADAGGALGGFGERVQFGASEAAGSLGRLTNSVGEIQWAAQAATSFGAVNAGPKFGPVILNEIHYAPRPGEVEFVEIHNPTSTPVALFDAEHPANTWRIGGIGYSFPAGATLAANGYAVVCGGDPALFRAVYGIPQSTPVYGPFAGTLQDSGELLELQRPLAPMTKSDGGRPVEVVPYVTVDAVRYAAAAPWPVLSEAIGASLERRRPVEYGNDPKAWQGGKDAVSPGGANDSNRSPRVQAGGDLELVSVVYPVNVSLNGVATDDGLPSPPRAMTYRWSQAAGPAGVSFGSAESLKTTVQLPGQGIYTLRLTASDGERTAFDDLTVSVNRPLGGQQELFPLGSEWRYLDDGTDQGTAWRERGFDDSKWASGRGQLGYSVSDPENDEVTKLGFGGNTGAKFITYYFRRTFDLADPGAVQELRLRFIRDDGIVVYLNGTEVMRDNLPADGAITFRTLANSAIGGADESTVNERVVDTGPLVAGVNTIAVEMHQNAGSSSDLSFDLGVVARMAAVNAAPMVRAPDLVEGVAGEPVVLAGAFGDDGLPNPPGSPTILWRKTAGPGTVSFESASVATTAARFSVAGDYTVELSVNDGERTAQATTRVSVKPGGVVAPPVLSWVEVGSVPGVLARLQLERTPGQTYTIEYRDALTGGEWVRWADVDAGVGAVSWPVAANGAGASRFYRAVSPRKP